MNSISLDERQKWAPQSLQSLNRVLTARGYAIRKDFLSEEKKQDLRRQLTVAPQVLEKYNRGAESFPVYQESAQRFYVPRRWGFENFGEPEASTLPEGLDLPEAALRFAGQPYDYQERIVDSFLEAGAEGLICVPCGRGKTVMALYAALCIGKRFLIIVDKEFLANQWRGELDKFCPGVRVGILQGSKVETEPELYDCTICMLQSVYPKEFPADFFKDYGFTIFDECHKLGAQQFSRCLAKIQTKHLLGLSATPDRDDGLTKVFEWYIGKPVYQERVRDPDPTVQVKAVWFRLDDEAYTEVPTDWKGEVVTARLLTKLVEFQPRTDRILEIIRETARDARRQILVLSERKAHLAAFEEGLAQLPIQSPWKLRLGYYIGGMKQEVLDKNATEAQVLLATYAMASEALNIKSLNAVVLASPRKKVEQSTGRILRLRPEQRVVDPLIFDVIDSHDTYVRQWWTRQRYYKQCNYSIQNIGRARAGGAQEECKEDLNVCLIIKT